MKLLPLLTVLLISLCGSSSAAPDKVICYYGSWATYRNGNGKFEVSDIDTTLCTHLIYSFVGLNTDGSIRILDPSLEVNKGNLKKLTSLKTQNPALKTLVAIGGWNEGSSKYSAVAADATKRAVLIKSAVALLQTYDFDGFDLDWEYPAQRGGAASDKVNYVTLLKEFREEFDKHGYLLTAAVAASSGSVDISYNVPELSKYLDVINVMTYDFHGSYDGVTGQNAPLYASSIDISAASKLLNVESAIRGWISKGASPSKIALGVGSYGRTYTLVSSSNNKLGAPVLYAGSMGPYTFESGMLGYIEICESIAKGGWTVVWDDEQKTPYAYKGNQWVGYDNPESVIEKVEFAKSLNLGGIMLWSIETEDFRGVCGTKYPLLNAINQTLKKGGGSSSTTAKPSTSAKSTTAESASTTTKSTTTESTTTESTTAKSTTAKPPPSTELCNGAGYVRDPNNCAVFYYCLKSGSKYVPLKQSCASGLVYDLNSHSCNYPSLVKC